MTINFIQADADANKGFRIGHAQSVFQNNVTFTVTGYKLGSYEVVGKDGSVSKTKYADSAQNILLTTSVGEDLPLNRLLHKKDVLYNAKGEAKVVYGSNFRAALTEHLLKLGRRTDDSAMLNGSVESVAKHAVTFFGTRVLICRENPGFAKDDKGKLVDRISPFITIEFQA